MEITQLHLPLLIYPDGDYPTTQHMSPANWPQDGDYPITLDRPSANLPQLEITLLHHLLLIYPRWRLPLLHLSCSFIPDGDYHITPPCSFTPDGDYLITPPPANLPPDGYCLTTPSPAHLPQMEITLLHQYALESSSSFTTLKDQQSSLDMERWLTPWRTSTYERPFIQEGNYIISIVKAQIGRSSGRSTKMRCSMQKTFYPWG